MALLQAQQHHDDEAAILSQVHQLQLSVRRTRWNPGRTSNLKDKAEAQLGDHHKSKASSKHIL